MTDPYFTDAYFKRLLQAEQQQQQKQQKSELLQQQNRLIGLLQPQAAGSGATRSAAASSGVSSDPGSPYAHLQACQLLQPIKRHQRPAHKEAELRRLSKIRDGVKLLSRVCGIDTLDNQAKSPAVNRYSGLSRHVSESALLKLCADRIQAVEQEITDQSAEIERLRALLSVSTMPSSQAIDYVQTRWLESPRFELFYKLIAQSVTDAFTDHLQAAADSRLLLEEKFPEQWLDRIAAPEELKKRSERYLERIRGNHPAESSQQLDSGNR
ncbi:hypothetical protein BOX15_Mlig011458g1 [Macrostomum lignano]|uniref:BHLH domain-containing protein n=1 Tax=Macrostomum lignano TaxID=282301 RepID=A0A267GEE0_9PLAT|nr:hypothetical protein BOX15_Mlig011458g1 [Macrostomum lignano]